MKKKLKKLINQYVGNCFPTEERIKRIKNDLGEEFNSEEWITSEQFVDKIIEIVEKNG